MKKKHLNAYMKLLVQLALTMVLSIGVFFFLGYMLDANYGGRGVCVGVGTFIGVCVGFYLIYLQLKSFF